MVTLNGVETTGTVLEVLKQAIEEVLDGKYRQAAVRGEGVLFTVIWTRNSVLVRFDSTGDTI